MSNEELLSACKTGLNIPLTSTSFDGILNQKMLTVKGYMLGSGVKSENLDNDLAVGVIVMGVVDLWNVQSGETKFSPIFNTLLAQLALRS